MASLTGRACALEGRFDGDSEEPISHAAGISLFNPILQFICRNCIFALRDITGRNIASYTLDWTLSTNKTDIKERNCAVTSKNVPLCAKSFFMRTTKTNRPSRMRRLVRDLVGRIFQEVRFLTLRLRYSLETNYPTSILCKSIAGRYRPVRVANGPITARCRFIKNAYWVTTLWTNSADDKLVAYSLFFPENSIWHFMQIVSIGDNLLEMSNSVFRENKKKNQNVICWQFTRVLSV